MSRKNDPLRAAQLLWSNSHNWFFSMDIKLEGFYFPVNLELNSLKLTWHLISKSVERWPLAEMEGVVLFADRLEGFWQKKRKEKEKEKEKKNNISRTDGCLQLSTVIICQSSCNQGFKRWQTETETETETETDREMEERERKIRSGRKKEIKNERWRIYLQLLMERQSKKTRVKWRDTETDTEIIEKRERINGQIEKKSAGRVEHKMRGGRGLTTCARWMWSRQFTNKLWEKKETKIFWVKTKTKKDN